MRLWDYFAGQRLEIRSPLPAETLADRINNRAGSAFWPFSSGTVGGVWLGHIRLRYRTWVFEYNAKPVLCGRLRNDGSGSSLDLRYRAPVWAYAFFLFWYLILASTALTLLGDKGEKIGPIAIFTLLLLAPVGFHMFGTRRSDEDLEAVLSFLSDCAEATR